MPDKTNLGFLISSIVHKKDTYTLKPSNTVSVLKVSNKQSLVPRGRNNSSHPTKTEDLGFKDRRDRSHSSFGGGFLAHAILGETERLLFSHLILLGPPRLTRSPVFLSLSLPPFPRPPFSLALGLSFFFIVSAAERIIDEEKSEKTRKYGGCWGRGESKREPVFGLRSRLSSAPRPSEFRLVPLLADDVLFRRRVDEPRTVSSPSEICLPEDRRDARPAAL